MPGPVPELIPQIAIELPALGQALSAPLYEEQTDPAFSKLDIVGPKIQALTLPNPVLNQQIGRETNNL